jgi:uncharacterized protein
MDTANLAAVASPAMTRWMLVLVAGVVSCGPGGAAEAVRPKDPTADNVLGEEKADCRSVQNGAEPLIVDWKPEQRGDLEVAMKDGLAVVRYGCDGIKLLADCRVDGEYGFIGMTRKEQLVRLENADEVRANLPLSGGAIGGELQRGSTIDIAMVLIGKRRTTWREPTNDDLKGSCGGATHYVRGANVGAFAVETGTRAKVRAAADILAASVSAQSESAKQMTNRDGDPASCAKASPSADAPPDQCGAAIRIMLAPIKKQALAIAPTAEAAGPAPERACPEGLVLAEGKCTKADAAPAYQCEPSNLEQCKAQCEKGHAGSCAAAGQALARSDKTAAAAAFQKACDGGEAAGCSGLGTLAVDQAQAVAAFEKGCGGGDAAGCRLLGTALRDEARAAALFDQACDGGDDLGCAEAAKAYASGRGVQKDEAKAAKLHKRACDGSVGESCAGLAQMYESGASGVGKNPILAEMLYRRGCQRSSGDACVGLGRVLLAAKPARADEAKLAFARGCGARAVLGCAAMKVLFGEQRPVVADPRMKMELTQACTRGSTRACASAGLLDAASGMAAAAKPNLERACRTGDAFGCLVLEKLK